ncbi:methyltransferase [bacterium]|nr:methyltransferase [bacterium]
MLFEVEITKYVPPGDGFAIYNNKAVFVPAAAVGDIVSVYTVKEKNTFIIAAIKDIITPSPDRVNADCHHYPLCGGCSLMHLSYQNQLELKKRMLMEVFSNHGFEIQPDIVSSPEKTNFRFRTQLRCVGGKIGFSERNSNRVVEISDCGILSKGISDTLKKLKRIGRLECEYMLLESSTTGEVAVSIVEGKKTSALPGFASSINEDYGFGKVELLSDGFAQSNPFVTRLIINRLVEECKKSDRMCELYCGCGTFSIPVALQTKALYGYDISMSSIATAKKNAERNELHNAEFKSGNLEKETRLQEADEIIVDPPRKGLGNNVIRQIAKSRANKLIYISCNPSTLARDAKDLKESAGFEISSITGYDMYCHSTHLEVFAILNR